MLDAIQHQPLGVASTIQLDHCQHQSTSANIGGNDVAIVIEETDPVTQLCNDLHEHIKLTEVID